jgi:tocopherol O-methyltransferase
MCHLWAHFSERGQCGDRHHQLEGNGAVLLKDQITQHYDELSPYYRDMWGVHIHHGYWKTGGETKEEAQEQLINEMISRARIIKSKRILDVGCGLGGTAIYLNRMLGAHVCGITISPTQVKIGNDLAKQSRADVQIVLMDAEAIEMDDRFDVVWSVEAISHLSHKMDCFRSIAGLLNNGGKLVIADWFRSGTASAAQQREFLEPIEQAMLVPRLELPCTYINYINQAGLNVTLFEDLSANVRKTWDLAIDLIGKPALWKFAAARGKEFMAFLDGFAAMRAGYKSKMLIYGALIAEKP